MAEASQAIAGAALSTANRFFGQNEQDDPEADHARD
jgi:hypothetical protein